MRFLVVLVLAAVIGCGWYLLTLRGPARGGEAAQPGGVTPAVRPAPIEEPRILRPASERSDVEAPTPRVEPEPGGLEDATPPPLPDLTQRFSGWSQSQMTEHLRDLELRLSSELDVTFKRRFEDGLYTSQAVDLEAEDPGAWDVLAKQAPPGEVGRGRLRFGDPDPSGKRTAEFQYVNLPRAEFPTLYERVDERDWLREQLSGEIPLKDRGR